MITALELILLLIIVVLAIPVLILLVQILASLFWLKHSQPVQLLNNSVTLAVIIPAHNESLGIATTLQSILPQIKSKDRLIVVADNCTDDTARIASELGAIVVVRENKELRGKGYALDFGLQALKNNPPDVVIIVDADCTISENGIFELSAKCMASQRPVQALYLMNSTLNSNIKSRVAEFAWIVKNQVRPLGFKMINLPCQLMGTGMAFTWSDITGINLASGHIAEDMKMGLDLCRAKKSPLFFPQVVVKSCFPSDAQAVKSQRTRWEHGHLSIILNDAPALLLDSIRARNAQMLGFTLDLVVPPLAVLTLISALVWMVSLLIHQFIPMYIVLICSSLLLITLTIAIFIAWIFFGRQIISFQQLCYAPIYALFKIPLYIKFFVSRQVEWVRSKRD